jgi:phosphomannomutase
MPGKQVRSASMSSLKFGTSGLRGLVVDLLGEPTQAYAAAFLRHLLSSGYRGERTLLVGYDLRDSSEMIADDCIRSAREAGWAILDCTAVPTPALALEAIRLGLPAIMVTGSHIPDDRNGLKFYTGIGEITKADEEGILASLRTAPTETDPRETDDEGTSIEDVGPEVLDRYKLRYLAAFGPSWLHGLVVGVYQHSTVARDVMVEVLESLGAVVVPFGRSDRFIPVDTEAHRPEDLAMIAGFSAGIRANGRLDAIVSADGDGDRPLIADAEGNVVRGDVVGLLTGQSLEVDTIVTPVTSISGIETAPGDIDVHRTRVGSPYVLAGMSEASPFARVMGFEANGGILLGSDIPIGSRMLPALPTRDAMLPIVAILGEIRNSGMALADIVAGLDLGHAAADRIKDYPPETGRLLIRMLLTDPAFVVSFFRVLGPVVSIDGTDGARLVFKSGNIVHYRLSGNAPELRCYVENLTEIGLRDFLEFCLDKAVVFRENEEKKVG